MPLDQAVFEYLQFERKYIEEITNNNKENDPLVNKINDISKLIVQVIVESMDSISDFVNIGKTINDIIVNKNYKQLMITYYICEKSYNRLIFERLFEISNYIKKIIDCLPKSSQYDFNISLIKFNHLINKLSQIKNNGYQEEKQADVDDLDRQETILGVKCKKQYIPVRKISTNPFLKLYERVRKDKNDRKGKEETPQVQLPPISSKNRCTGVKYRVSKQIYRKVCEMKTSTVSTPSTPTDEVNLVIEEYMSHEDRKRYSLKTPPFRDISLYPRESSLFNSKTK